jgi:four helix bundle protein
MHEEMKLESSNLWIEAKDLAVRICKFLLPKLPEKERFALASQLRRSAQSIPANVAEAYRRYGYRMLLGFAISQEGLSRRREVIYSWPSSLII